MHRRAWTLVVALTLIAACSDTGIGPEDAGGATFDGKAECRGAAQRCNGNNREFCKDGRWTFGEACVAPKFCSSKKNDCLVCEPDEGRCQVDEAQTCDKAGAKWLRKEICPKGTCKSGVCVKAPDSSVDVKVVITADNAYGFGYGTATKMANYFGGVENYLAAEIFSCPIGRGPESYTVPAASATAGNYLYVIAYADSSTTQGVIGQFKRSGARNPNVYTGTGDWQVCATGQNYSPRRGGPGGPKLPTINKQIEACEKGAAGTTPSGGWVDAKGTAKGQVAIGEDNSTTRGGVTAGNEFPVVCGIDKQAKWMWFNWSPASIKWPTQGSPFMWPRGGGTNPDRQFLIFRLKAEKIPTIK